MRIAVLLLIAALGLGFAVSPVERLLAHLKGFSPMPAEVQVAQNPYPGWKICRILARSLTAYFGGGRVLERRPLLYLGSRPQAERALSSAARKAGLRTVQDWHANPHQRPEYFRNEIVPYGFEALELGAGGARIYLGVSDHHKNRSGLSAVCLMSFEAP